MRKLTEDLLILENVDIVSNLLFLRLCFRSLQKANQSLKILSGLIEEERGVGWVGLPLGGVFRTMACVFRAPEGRDILGQGIGRGMKLAVFHLSDNRRIITSDKNMVDRSISF